MFLGRIVVKECFEVIDEIILVVGNFEIGHDDIVGSVGPIAFCLIIYSICFARKVKSLHDELAALLQKWTPLD